jgi:DNA-binding PadR family transcriptional regulator
LLERETTRRVTLGAVYACLDRLEAKGLVRSAMRAGTAERGGRSRRMFQLVPEGVRTLNTLREVRDRLYGATRPRASRGRA